MSRQSRTIVIAGRPSTLVLIGPLMTPPAIGRHSVTIDGLRIGWVRKTTSEERAAGASGWVWIDRGIPHDSPTDPALRAALDSMLGTLAS